MPPLVQGESKTLSGELAEQAELSFSPEAGKDGESSGGSHAHGTEPTVNDPQFGWESASNFIGQDPPKKGYSIWMHLVFQVWRCCHALGWARSSPLNGS